MVWTGILINGRTRLHVVANETMTGQRYIDEVLLPHVCLFRGAVGDKFVFMDDNATYLNPIENVWDALGRQVAGRNYPPTNKNTLIRALTEEWDKLPQQLLDNVVQSMKSKSASRLEKITGGKDTADDFHKNNFFEKRTGSMSSYWTDAVTAFERRSLRCSWIVSAVQGSHSFVRQGIVDNEKCS
ncbi:transposable element Tc1 transposase [Trichonephila clavipes]|nr:transposable element Tc1 transposase [Trichonephila clavipes]